MENTLTLEQRATMIINDCMTEKSNDPIIVFSRIAEKPYIRMHGPEHHVLNGASLLTAYANAGGNIALESALAKLKEQGLKMPGAACGLWGVCGAVTSNGAALAIIDGTGPLTADGSWGDHMGYTSAAIAAMGKIGGPRCCKRDGYTALIKAVDYINSNYGVKLSKTVPVCEFFNRNEQCKKEKCPFYHNK